MHRRCAVLSLYSIVALLLAAHSNAATSTTAAAIDRIEEVIVTARKREENAQTVPISIAAYGAEDLRQRSVANLAGLGQVTPNFLYGQKTQSGSSAGQIYIRGVGQHDNMSTFNPGVGLYVDGVYLGRAAANDLGLTDIDRVEVLYGPQGTLYGKNTNGGAVNITSRTADLSALRPVCMLELQVGNFDRFALAASMDVPLITDRAALQVSAARHSQRGYSERIDGEDQADQHRSSARAQLRVKVTDSLEGTLRVDGTTFDEHTSAFNLVAVRTASAIPVLYATSTAYRYDERWLTGNDYKYNGSGPNKNAGSVWGTSLTLQVTGTWGTLKSISAWRELHVDNEFDPDGSPLAVLDIFNSIDQQQVSQELQLTSSSASGKLDWVTGIYFFEEAVQENQPAVVADEFFHGAANFDPRLHVENRNYAAYGQATLALTDQLKITVGARAGHDEARVGRIQVSYPVPVVQQPFTQRAATWSSFLPRVSLEYQWMSDLMTYVSAAEGSKTGGFNGRAGSIAEFTGFAPEKVWTYEVGVRSDWLDRRLRINVTAFYSVYSDFQILLNKSVTDPVTGAPVAFSFVGNMPEATIAGGELSITATPMAGLQLSAGAGITDGKYRKILAGAPVTTRSEFVDAPGTALSLAAQYAVNIGSATVTAHVDYSHKSTIQYDYGNSSLVDQRPYGLLNARLTADLANTNLSLFVFGTNLSDEHYAIGGHDDGSGGSLGLVVQQMGAPREFGLGARYRF